MADRQADTKRLATRRRELDQRHRLAFLDGAEVRARQTMGRGLTDEELRRIIERYPGCETDSSGASPAAPRANGSSDASS